MEGTALPEARCRNGGRSSPGEDRKAEIIEGAGGSGGMGARKQVELRRREEMTEARVEQQTYLQMSAISQKGGGRERAESRHEVVQTSRPCIAGRGGRAWQGEEGTKIHCGMRQRVWSGRARLTKLFVEQRALKPAQREFPRLLRVKAER
eukprot:5444271-Pleurochrysis_carterae.AAC.2